MTDVQYDLEKKSRDVRNMEKDLQYSRSPFVTWGKQAMFAIDGDHAGRLIQTFKTKSHLGADINAQTTKAGYGGYSWTAYIHNFLGDTALHLALRQKKFICAHALLVLGARCDILNYAGVTQEELVMTMTGKTLTIFRSETERVLVTGMSPYDLHLLPDNLVYRGLAKQSWDLMLDGRNEYTQLPKNAAKLTDHPVIHDSLETSHGDIGEGVTTASVLEQDELEEDKEDGKTYLKAVMAKHGASLGLLGSSAGSISSYDRADAPPADAVRENGFCFNDVRDVEEFVKAQNALLFRLDREKRLQVSGLSLLKTNDVDEEVNNDDGDKSVTSIAQGLLNNAAKSFKNFKYLQRAIAIEETEEKKSCLDMPYRHLTKLSTRTNMIHMNIGDNGLRRISRHLPGNHMLTHLVLANARITSRGLRFLCDAMTFMDSLVYLDLSQNCLDDLAMLHLGDLLGEGGALSSCPSLKKLTLLGNRVTGEGARIVTEAALGGGLEYLNLCNNPITPPDVEAMRLLVEVTQREQGGEIKAKKIILFDNLLKKKPLCGYGGF